MKKCRKLTVKKGKCKKGNGNGHGNGNRMEMEMEKKELVSIYLTYISIHLSPTGATGTTVQHDPTV